MQRLGERSRVAVSGRQNAVGSIEPRRSTGSVNGAIPTIAVGSGDNCDIKVPYRLPITAKTHESICPLLCYECASTDAIIDSVDASQSAQIGYHCDYCNKRQPIGVHESREWAKGHRQLSQKINRESVTYVTRRHAQRIVSDCFARGILRTPNETVKLNDAVGHGEPTQAELTATAPFNTFPGESSLSLVEQRASTSANVLEKGLLCARSKERHGTDAVVLMAAVARTTIYCT